MTMIEMTGLILAGGASRRMGRDKAELPIAGISLLERGVRLLNKEMNNIIIAGGSHDITAYPGVHRIGDERPGAGPLYSIAGVFHSDDAQRYFVLACDLPAITSGIVQCIAAHAHEADIVYAGDAHTAQPLCAVWSRSIAPALDEYIAKGERKVSTFLHSVPSRMIRLDEKISDYRPSLMNLNSPSDLCLYLRNRPEQLSEFENE